MGKEEGKEEDGDGGLWSGQDMFENRGGLWSGQDMFENGGGNSIGVVERKGGKGREG